MKEGDRVIISGEDDTWGGTIVKFSDCLRKVLVRLDCYLFGFVWYGTSQVKVKEDSLPEKTREFNPANYLDSEEAIQEYWKLAEQDGNTVLLENAKKVISEARVLHNLPTQLED